MAGIAEHDPARAEPIHQAAHHALGLQVPHIAQQLLQQLLLGCRQCFTLEQMSGNIRHLLVTGFLLQKTLVVGVAMRVEEAQSAKMPGPAQLFRRGAEEQHPQGLFRQGFHQVVLQAGLLLAPVQVMGLVHHQQIPFLLQSGAGDLWRGQKKVQAAQHLLFLGERIVRIRGFEAFPVEQGKAQIEAAQHLHQPLMQQGLGHQNQHPSGAARQEHAVQDEAGLYGLAQAHLVRQQHPGQKTPRRLPGDIQLMGNQADARPHQALHRRQGLGGQLPPGLLAQVEPIVAVQAPRQQLLPGTVELQMGADVHLCQAALSARLVPAQVDVQPVPFLHFQHREGRVLGVLQAVAGFQQQARQGRIRKGIDPAFTNGREQQFQAAVFDLGNQAQAQIRIRIAQPALAGQVACFRQEIFH